MDFTENEINQVRKETSGTLNKIHLNNAGSSLPPNIVTQTVIKYLEEEALCGGYETELKYSAQINKVYELIATLINAETSEVAIVENATTAWGIALNGIQFTEGDIILTSEIEYVSNFIGFLRLKEKHGIEIEVIPNDTNGEFSLLNLENRLSPKTRLIAITHVASTGGMINPIEEIGKIAEANKILYMVDACQSIGQLPVDVKKIRCDILCVTGRKFLRAPRGTGFLYVRQEIQDALHPTFIDGFSGVWTSPGSYSMRKDARKYELFERSKALTLGLGKAVEYSLNIGINRIWQRIEKLSALLREELSRIEGVTVHDTGNRKCGIVTFSVSGQESVLIKDRLSEININVSISYAGTTLIDMSKRGLNALIRASVHYYNTEAEIQIFCREINRISKG